MGLSTVGEGWRQEAGQTGGSDHLIICHEGERRCHRQYIQADRRVVNPGGATEEGGMHVWKERGGSVDGPKPRHSSASAWLNRCQRAIVTSGGRTQTKQ